MNITPVILLIILVFGFPGFTLAQDVIIHDSFERLIDSVLAPFSNFVDSAASFGKDVINEAPDSFDISDVTPRGFMNKIRGFFGNFFGWLDDSFRDVTGGIGITEVVKSLANFFIWLFTLLTRLLKWLVSFIPN